MGLRQEPAPADPVERVRRLLEGLKTGVSERDRGGRFPWENLARLAAAGILGMTVPPRWGGLGASDLDSVRVIFEIARVDAATALLVEAHNSLHAEGVWRFGTDRQRDRWLPDLTSGKALGAFALTEEEAGSDARAIRLRADRVDGGYVLHGEKRLVTGGGAAHRYLVFAATGEGAPLALVVEKGAPGLRFGPPELQLGLRAAPTAALTFDGVPVPEEDRLGQEGEGIRIAFSLLDGGRLGIAAQACGILAAALERSVAHAMSRRQFGRGIGEFGAIQQMLGNMCADLEAARALTEAAARRRGQGDGSRALSAAAKLIASRAAVRHTGQAVQILGGLGYLAAGEVERLYREAKATEIYEGTSEILCGLLAADLLRPKGREDAPRTGPPAAGGPVD